MISDTQLARGMGGVEGGKWLLENLQTRYIGQRCVLGSSELPIWGTNCLDEVRVCGQNRDAASWGFELASGLGFTFYQSAVGLRQRLKIILKPDY